MLWTRSTKRSRSKKRYDEDLIRSVIQYATVLSDTELRIHIKGGLEVTEQLPQYYTRRCRRK